MKKAQRRGASVATLLLVVVALPMSGLAYLVYSDVSDARAARETVIEIQGHVDQNILLIDLRTRLLQEQSWRLISTALTDFGVSSQTVADLFGVDPAAELERATSNLDEALAMSTDLDLTDTIRQRRPPDGTALADAVGLYDDLTEQISNRVDERVASMLATSAQTADAAPLSNAIQVLAATSDAEAAFTERVTNYFGARFSHLIDNTTTLPSRATLLRSTAAYDTAMSRLDDLDATDSASMLWSRLEESEEYRYFTELSGHAVDDIIAGIAPSISPQDLFAEFNAAAPVFAVGESLVDAHGELLDLAAVEVRLATEEQAAATSRRMYTTLATVVLLLASTLVVAALIRSLIVGPTRRLAAGAEKIENGDLRSPIPVQGPREIRDATRALNNTAATLTLVEQQARQMAFAALHPDDVGQAAPGPLGDSLRSAMETLATSITEREALRKELTHEASHDSLTGIQNRKAVLRQLDTAVANAEQVGHKAALLFLDLDAFKSVNDRLGHAAGDFVLKTVAERLRAALRATDQLGRLGGDEFLVLVEPIGDVADATTIAQAIIDSLTAPIETPAGTASIGVSIGIEIIDGSTIAPDVLLARADAAVYEAKAVGPGVAIVGSSFDGPVPVTSAP